MAKSLILHKGACDTVKQQSEELKQDFIDLLAKVRPLHTVVFVSSASQGQEVRQTKTSDKIALRSRTGTVLDKLWI